MKQKKQTKVTDLENVVQAVNEYFDDYGGLEAEVIESDFAIFPSGEMWICDDCDNIHIGFHLNADASLIAHIALALYEYHERVQFETVPIYADDRDIFEDDDAIFEYGKSLINSVACNDCTNKVLDEELNAPGGGK